MPCYPQQVIQQTNYLNEDVNNVVNVSRKVLSFLEG